MKIRKRSIREKILLMVLSVSLLTLIVIILTAVLGMVNMRNHIILSNNTLGQTAAQDSQGALELQTVAQLSEISKSKAELSDEKFGALEKYVQFMAMQSSNIYSKPEGYIQLTVDSFLSSGKDTLVPHLLYSEDVSLESISKEIGQISNVTDILYSIVENDRDVLAAYVGTESGFIVMADRDPGNKIRTLDPRKRVWYTLAKEKKGLIWTDVYDDALGRGLNITCAAPFYDAAGNFKGVVAIDSLLTTLNDIIVGTKIGTTGYAFVLNEKGDMIISPTIEKSGDSIVRENFLESNNIILKAAAEKMISRKSGVARLIYNGRDVFLAYAPMKNLPWSIATMIDVSEAIKPALQSKASIITLASQAIDAINKNILTVSIFFGAVAILSAAVIIILSFLLSGRITKPIVYLTGKVSKVVEGDFDVEIDVKTGDEIEKLADAFGNMTVEIKKYIANLAVETARRERMNSELAVASQIQNSMLPGNFKFIEGESKFDINAVLRMAKVVGGDFYDYFLISEDKLAFVIADVSGKGIPAALFMMMAKTVIKNNALAGYDIGDIFNSANNSLCESNEGNMFITAFLGIIDFSKGKFTYVNAGHNPPLIKKSGKDYAWLQVNSGFVLGGMENIIYKPMECNLEKGDRIFCYTDGVTEAMNEKDELYSDERLMETLNAKKDIENLDELITEIKTDVDVFAGEADQADDITMLVVEMKQKASG